MKKHTVKAFRASQNGYSVYVGFCPSNELVQFTTVDFYDSKLEPTDSNQGYQRPAEASRISRIGKFLLDNSNHLLFPNAVLLASRSPLKYDSENYTIEIANPLQIIDGQHRIEGIKYALNKKGSHDVHKLNLPFVIIETDDKLVEMTQFRVINGTAKSVRTDLVNMILTATYSKTERNDIPIKDQWKVVVTNVISKLAKDNNSPWYDKIVLPDEVSTKGSSKIVRATSFITSLRPVYQWLKDVRMDVDFSSLEEETDFMYNVVSEYWKALEIVNVEAFSDPDKYVIQKTPGLFSLHKLLKLLIHNMYLGRRDYTTENFIDFLGDNPEITDSEFWFAGDPKNNVAGGPASTYGSMKGFDELFKIISEHYKDSKVTS